MPCSPATVGYCARAMLVRVPKDSAILSQVVSGACEARSDCTVTSLFPFYGTSVLYVPQSSHLAVVSTHCVFGYDVQSSVGLLAFHGSDWLVDCAGFIIWTADDSSCTTPAIFCASISNCIRAVPPPTLAGACRAAVGGRSFRRRCQCGNHSDSGRGTRTQIGYIILRHEQVSDAAFSILT